MSNEFIIPTKSNPIFKAECDYFGYIETNVYKDALMRNNTTSVFEISFMDSVNELHKWIKENEYILNEYPKCKFNIYAVDGSCDKFGEYVMKKVYTISATKAKKYLI